MASEPKVPGAYLMKPTPKKERKRTSGFFNDGIFFVSIR